MYSVKGNRRKYEEKKTETSCGGSQPFAPRKKKDLKRDIFHTIQEAVCLLLTILIDR